MASCAGAQLAGAPPPMTPRLPSLDDSARWGSAALVMAAGWAAGRGLAVGMDTLHAATCGFALSGSIFLALAVRGPLPALRLRLR